MTETNQCPIEITVGLIGNKWKPIIIYYLFQGTKRFCELKKLIPKISQKVLTDNLRDLEDKHIVHRQVYIESPIKVEYSLTTTGLQLHDIIHKMQDFGEFYTAIKK